MLIEKVVNLITTLIKSLQKEDRKNPGRLKVTRKKIVKGGLDEELVMELDIPLSSEIEDKLNENLKKYIEDKS